ncbi:hypothetical protein J6590_092024 [Homalodisca vitripennis]|nr:hypothetical protein J6590_092024 [Homalodisca vitripennis]
MGEKEIMVESESQTQELHPYCRNWILLEAIVQTGYWYRDGREGNDGGKRESDTGIASILP